MAPIVMAEEASCKTDEMVVAAVVLEAPQSMGVREQGSSAVTGQMSRAWISFSRDLSSLLGWHCVPVMLAIEAK
jgi:hypothetical protein